MDKSSNLLFFDFISSLSTLLANATAQHGSGFDKDPLGSEDPLLYAKDTSVEPRTQLASWHVQNN